MISTGKRDFEKSKSSSAGKQNNNNSDDVSGSLHF
jgi:hypothetical protein